MDYDSPAVAQPPRRRAARILGATAVLLVVAVLLLVLSVLQTRRPSSTLRQNGFLSSEEAAMFYAGAGNGLAAACSDRISLYTSSGKCTASENIDLISPICVGSPLLGAYYDPGAPGLHTLYPDGAHRFTDTDGSVDFVDVNETGLVTVILEKGDSFGTVMVYDTDLTPLFRWDTGRGIPLIGRTCGDDRLCVSSITRESSQLHFFRIDQPQEQTQLSFPGEILLDMDFLSDGTLAAVLESRLILVDPDGQLISSTEYNGRHLQAWSLNGSFAAVATVSGLGGGSGTITAVASDGQILGSESVPLHVGALSGEKDELLVLFDGGEATLYDRTMEQLVSYQPEKDVDQVFLTPNGMAFFAGPSGVTLVDFSR